MRTDTQYKIGMIMNWAMAAFAFVLGAIKAYNQEYWMTAASFLAAGVLIWIGYSNKKDLDAYLEQKKGVLN